MVLPATLDRGKEKFVQWKEPTQLKADRGNAHAHASTSKGRKKKHRGRLKSQRSSPRASIQGPRVEEEGHARSPTTVLSERGVRTSLPTPAALHSSAPPPTVEPPRRMHSTRSEGASKQTADLIPEVRNRRAARRESVRLQNDSAAQEEEGTAGPEQRTTPRGKAIRTADLN